MHRYPQVNRKTRNLVKEKGCKTEMVDTLQIFQRYTDKIVIPEVHRGAVLNWYHYYLNHPGESRMENTIRQKLYWKGMTSDIKYFVKTCETCKKFKKSRQKYGQLPLKDVSQEITPWDVVHIDTIGP